MPFSLQIVKEQNFDFPSPVTLFLASTHILHCGNETDVDFFFWYEEFILFQSSEVHRQVRSMLNYSSPPKHRCLQGMSKRWWLQWCFLWATHVKNWQTFIHTMVTMLNYLTILPSVSQLWQIYSEWTSTPRILSNGYATCGFLGVEVHIYLEMANIEKHYPKDTFFTLVCIT